jgi:hypothetical protein
MDTYGEEVRREEERGRDVWSIAVVFQCVNLGDYNGIDSHQQSDANSHMKKYYGLNIIVLLYL